MSHTYDHALYDLLERVGDVYRLTEIERITLGVKLRPLIVAAVEQRAAAQNDESRPEAAPEVQRG